jgi:hypothetical protein
MENKYWKQTDPRKEVENDIEFAVAFPSTKHKGDNITAICHITNTNEGRFIYFRSSDLGFITEDQPWPKGWFWIELP